jgi:hypothetical protein
MISFVMLTWNSEKTISASIESILNVSLQNGIDNFEIYIVDNGSSDRTLQILNQYEHNQHVKTISLHKNYGTTYSRNVALKRVSCEFVCVIDSDVEIETWDIKKSIEFIQKNKCLVAPALSYPDGSFQNSVKRFPTIFSKLMKLTKIFFGVQKYASLDFYKGMPFSEIVAVETAISALWLFPVSLLNDVGYLDEKIFYSPEDVDYCVRIRKAGYPIYYYPEIKAVHHTQQISHTKPISKLSRSHLYGLIYYYFKHKYLFSPRRIRELPMHNPFEGIRKDHLCD